MASSADSFIASREQESYDAQMATYDCWGSQAHVLMTSRQGILDDADAKAALEALIDVEDEIVRDGFHYRPGLGGQLTLEAMILDRVGDRVGLQVHTGRSRNDQVLVTQKLFVRDRVLEVFRAMTVLTRLCIERADEGKLVIMPGYTHMQPARPTTVGQWFAMNASAYMRDLERLRDAYLRHNVSPLGAADSYGTSWPLDRQYVADLLAFDRVDQISIDAISNRGESDTDFLSALAFFATHMSKAAQDMLLFTTYEFGYAKMTEAVAERMGKLTGSSIMPQKKNPDIFELLRAQVSEVHAHLVHCLELLKALPMGYNRDSRDTKGPIIRGLQSVQSSVDQMVIALAGVEFDEDRMLRSVSDNYCMATDLAEWLAQRCSIPFRIVHRIIGRTVKDAIAADVKLYDVPLSVIEAQAQQEGYELDITAAELAAALDPRDAVQRRQCLGGPSEPTMNTWLAEGRERLHQLESWVDQQQHRIATAREEVRRRAGATA
jgi:argininosuccinate lyase